MKIAIRMDDITPGMDWEKFNKFKKILDDNDIKPLIGVVPNNEDPMLNIDPEQEDFWGYVKNLQEKGWIISQHGYNHVYKTKKMGCFPLNQLSEYAGLSYEEQYEKLKKGKDILNAKGIFTDFFMAPAHSFDNNTLKALSQLGFSRITDGFGYYPYNYRGLVFYPISFRQGKSLKETRDGYTTFVYHTNMMNENDFVRFEKLMNTRRADFVSYDEFLLQGVENRSVFGVLKERIVAFTKFILVTIKR